MVVVVVGVAVMLMESPTMAAAEKASAAGAVVGVTVVGAVVAVVEVVCWVEEVFFITAVALVLAEASAAAVGEVQEAERFLRRRPSGLHFAPSQVSAMTAEIKGINRDVRYRA